MPNVVILQRNIKRGNVREFDDSYNRGYTDIWASEVDADFDTLYAAWNDVILNTTDTLVGPTPPMNPRVGDLWWRNTDGNMFIYYDDGNSKQFVPVSSSADYVGSGLPTGPAGGSLAGQYPNPVIAPGAVTDANIFQVSWVKITGAPTSMPPSGPAGGVLTGTYPNPTGVNWSGVLNAPTTYPPSGIAGGALTGTYPNPGVNYNSITGRPTIPTTLPPSGPAGGSLTGTYPNPILVVGATLGVLGGAQLGTPVNIGLNTEAMLVEMTWGSRGGRYIVMGGIHGRVWVTNSGAPVGATSQLRLDGTAGVPTDGNIISWQQFGGLQDGVNGTMQLPFAITHGISTGTAGAGTRRIKMTGWITGQQLATSTVDTAWLMVYEPA